MYNFSRSVTKVIRYNIISDIAEMVVSVMFLGCCDATIHVIGVLWYNHDPSV